MSTARRSATSTANRCSSTDGVSERIDPVQILAALQGLPLWSAGRAVDMATFQFGARHRRESRGRTSEHGDHALHVQCAWRFVRDARTLVGSADDFDAGSGAVGLRDRLVDEVLERPLVVEDIGSSPDGSLTVTFTGGPRLDLLPDRLTASDEEAEHWRSFAPGKDEPHLVCRSTGFYLD